MARKTAIVNAEKCEPAQCGSGICVAMSHCPRKMLKQEAPYEVAYVSGDPSLCGGCFKCLEACPLQAIFKV